MHQVDSITYLQKKLTVKEAELDLAYDALAKFTKAISHDINAPVNTLMQLLGMLKDGHEEQLDEEGQELLEMVLVSAQRSHELSSGLMEYSRQCRPSATREIVDIALVLDKVMLTHQELTKQHNVTIEVAAMPEIASNNEALTTILSHLLENAIKFSPADGEHRTISVNAQSRGEHIELQISDQGISIDPDLAQDLFTPLKRLVTRAEYPGAGLGLSLCTIIVQQLGGSIWVTPSASNGSTFHVQLPDPK